MWRPGEEEEEEMGMPVVSLLSSPLSGGGHDGSGGEDDCDWDEHFVFDHDDYHEERGRDEDASDAEETASEVSSSADSGDLARRDSSSLFFRGEEAHPSGMSGMTRTVFGEDSSAHHKHDYEEEEDHELKTIQQSHHEEEVVTLGGGGKKTSLFADVAVTEVLLEGRKGLGSSSPSGQPQRNGGVVRNNYGAEVGGDVGGGAKSARRVSSSDSAGRLEKKGGLGVVEDFVKNFPEARTSGGDHHHHRSGFSSNDSSNGVVASEVVVPTSRNVSSRCGLCENFGVGGAPTRSRVWSVGSHAEIPTTGAAAAAGAVVHGLPDRDLPLLSSPRMQSKWLALVKNSTSSGARAIPHRVAVSGASSAKASAVLGGPPGVSAAKNEASVTMPKWRQSAPVNFAHVAAERKNGRWAYSPPSDDDDCGDNDWNNEIRIYPHELVARTKFSHRMVAFSVADGGGRTLKGRELRRLRDCVMRNLMGFESRYPDGTLHEFFRPNVDGRQAIALNVMD